MGNMARKDTTVNHIYSYFIYLAMSGAVAADKRGSTVLYYIYMHNYYATGIVLLCRMIV